uniref:Uncharacterized protein n=1 Tax=Arundo donax TaxID=35708 RepID=A0A0A9CGZ6_ARUDO
MLLESSALA